MPDGPVRPPRPVSGREALAVLGLVALALALRAWGTGFGLPHTYHPDEHQYVDTAVRMLGGDLDPGRFNNPSLVKYALAGVLALDHALGRAAGTVSSVAEAQARFAADPTHAYRLARLVVATLGALTVAAVWALGRAAYGRRAGLAAAALTAVAFLHVRESHFAVSDVPATLLVTCALALAVGVMRRGRRRDYVAAGAVLGLAAGAKYLGALAAVGLLVAHLLGHPVAGATRVAWPRRLLDRRLWWAAGAAGAAFLAVVPYAVPGWQAFHADVALLLERGREGFKGLALTAQPGWLFYLSSLRWGLGLPFLAAALAALVAALARRRRADLLLALFVLAAYAHLSRQLLLFARFMLPLLPALAVLTAAMLDRAARRLTADPGRQRLALAAATAVLAAVPLASSLRFDRLLQQPDTRTLAKAWIEHNLPAGARVVVHSNGPELQGAGHPAPASDRTFDLEVVGTTGVEQRPLAAYGEDGVDYVVLSSFSTERRLLDAAADARRREYFAQLAREFELLAEFRPAAGPEPPFLFAQVYGPATGLWRLERPGPTVTVYRVPRPGPASPGAAARAGPAAPAAP